MVKSIIILFLPFNLTKQYLLSPLEEIQIIPYELRFKTPARTSRSVMNSRLVYFVVARSSKLPGITGWGEIAPLDGLSPEGPEFHEAMRQLSGQYIPLTSMDPLSKYPSVQFGLETALLDLNNGGNHVWFRGPFSQGESSIPINGLIWMGDQEFMLSQIRKKLSKNYPCLKLKIGGIDFHTEVDLLKVIRGEFSHHDLELRLDANGSFHPDEAEEKLKILSAFDIHSIEQPIPAGHHQQMAALCRREIIPIALDEELIGIKNMEQKENLLNTIRPQYIIFKPSLIGGLSETESYIELCNSKGIKWWVTSALESNVGLNILAQFCDHLGENMVQGLGTGKLFKNNIQSPLREEKGKIFIDYSAQWGCLEQ